MHGGFFQDYQGSYSEGACGGLSRYIGNTDYDDYLAGDRANPDCLFNRQSLLNRTDRPQFADAQQLLPERACHVGSRRPTAPIS